MKELEKQLKALANQRRLKIIKILKTKHALSVGEVALEIKLSFKATSKHLIILHRANFIERNQQSLVVYYQISKTSNPLLQTIFTIL